MFKTKTILSAFIVFFLFSCSKKNAVELIDRNFLDEISLGADLRFTFDKDLAPDSLLGIWDSTEYVSFEPKIKGSFKWVGPRELVFSPHAVFKPAERFHGRVTSEVTRFSEYKLMGETEFDFSTPYLRIESMLARWVRDTETKESYPKIDLKFNYFMPAKELTEKMKVELNGGNQVFEIASEEHDRNFSLRLVDLEKHDDDLQGHLQFEESMHLEQQSEEPGEVELGFVLKSPYRIEVLTVSTEHDGDEGKILIYTSQPLKSENLKSFIHIEPEIDFTLVQETDYLSIQSSALEPKESYTLTIDAGVRGVNGGKLKSDYSTYISFAELEPELKFNSSDGMFISAKGNKVVELTVTAIPIIRIRISKIYENNILSSVYGYYYPGSMNYYDYYDGYYYEESTNYYGHTKGDVIYDEVVETSSLPGAKYNRKLRLDIEDMLASYDGIYHLHISSENNRWRSISKFISVSDIGIIAKHGDHSVHVFCNSLDNTDALEGAEVRVFGKNNQMMVKGTTNKDGTVKLDLPHGDIDGFFPGMITVKTGSDFNFLPLGKTKINTSQFDVGGKTLNASGLDCFLYPERDLYRPGEEINMVGIVRDHQFQTINNVPVKVIIRLPSGVIFKELRKTLNEQGSFELTEEIPKSSQTGVYRVEVSTMNDVLLSTEQIMVEEFIPDRIKVSTSLNQKEYIPTEEIVLSVDAVNFFGPPARERNVEAEIQFDRVAFSPPNYRDFNFDLEGLRGSIAKSVYELKTDDDGHAEIRHSISGTYQNRGKMKVKIFTTVFDENGRTVSKTNEADLFTQKYFAGLKTSGYYVTVNRPIESEIVVLDQNGNPQTKDVEIKVIRHEYRTVLEESGRYYNYRSQHYPVTVVNKKLLIKGKNKYTFRPTESGKHTIMIRVDGQLYYVEKDFYVYHSSYAHSSSFEVNKEGSIDITANKESYNSGETAKLLFKAPFDGKMLVTLEQNDVLQSYYVQVRNHAAEIQVSLKDEHLPNVYVSATLFKAHQMTDMPLTVAHGYHSLSVTKPDRELNVQIKAVEKSRSDRRQKIKVKTTPNAFVSIAVVDEGILQITGFQTPNPYDAFYGKRALEVNSFDLYPYLFKEIAYFSSTAGDGMFESKKMLNPVNSNRVKLVSKWTGLVKADKNGNVDFTIDIPQFSGKTEGDGGCTQGCPIWKRRICDDGGRPHCPISFCTAVFVY